MDGPPVRDGAVRIEGGVIAEVSDRLSPDRRFADAVILPGLVNAHTHLEYGSMSAMGDGLPFSPWIEQLIARKSSLVRDDYLAQSHAGVHACLAGGVTTIADCSYADTVVEAAIAQGLRAIVYLEAFSDQGDPAGLMAGRLGPDTVAIHLVRADPDAISLLAGLGVPAVHCPRSNALLGCGTAPVPELLDAGLALGLGTDSPASALTFDMWDEMRAAILVARARARRPDALSAERVLRMATIDGARAIGMADSIGSLAPHKRADLTVLDLSATPFLPWEDPITAAVYGGTPDRVLLTIVDGQIRFNRDGGAADTEPARRVRAKMLDR